MSRIGGKFLATHKETWTTGTTTNITHSLGTLDVLVVVREIDTGKILTISQGWGDSEVGVNVVDANTIQLVGDAAPTGSGHRVSILPL